MKLRLAVWFLLLTSISALGLGNNGVPPFFGVPGGAAPCVGTWTDRMLTSVSGFIMAASADTQKIVVADYMNALSVSSDNGATFTARSSAGMHQWQGIADSSDGMTIVVVWLDGSTNGVFVSTDNGMTWVDRTPMGIASATFVAMSGDGQKIVLTDDICSGGGPGLIYISVDQGQHWTTSNPIGGPNCWQPPEVSRDGSTFYVINDDNSMSTNQLFVSTDAGASWTNISPALSSPVHQFQSVATSLDGSSVAISDNGGVKDVWTSTDFGATWAERLETVGLDFDALSMSDDGAVLLGGNSALYVSQDGGATWAQQPTAPTSSTWSGVVVAAATTGKSVAINNDAMSNVWTSCAYDPATIATWTPNALDTISLASIDSGFGSPNIASSAVFGGNWYFTIYVSNGGSHLQLAQVSTSTFNAGGMSVIDLTAINATWHNSAYNVYFSGTTLAWTDFASSFPTVEGGRIFTATSFMSGSISAYQPPLGGGGGCPPNCPNFGTTYEAKVAVLSGKAYLGDDGNTPGLLRSTVTSSSTTDSLDLHSINVAYYFRGDTLTDGSFIYAMPETDMFDATSGLTVLKIDPSNFTAGGITAVDLSMLSIPGFTKIAPNTRTWTDGSYIYFLYLNGTTPTLARLLLSNLTTVDTFDLTTLYMPSFAISADKPVTGFTTGGNTYVLTQSGTVDRVLKVNSTFTAGAQALLPISLSMATFSDWVSDGTYLYANPVDQDLTFRITPN